MNFTRRFFQAGLAAGLVTFLLSTQGAQAQDYPSKPIRIVVGAPAGGSSDYVARVLGEGLSPLLGQPVVIDNKPGAGGVIAVQDLVKSPHDGYTLLVLPQGVVSELPHIIKMPFDPAKVLRPLVEVVQSGLVFVAAPQTQVKSVKDAVAYVKAHSGKVSFASYSSGSLSHTLGLALNRHAGLDMVHVGYKGSPPALTDLMGGHVQFMFDGPATSLPMAQSGKLTVLATTAPKRMAVMPDVPTFAELGYKDLTVTAGILLWCPPDVPAAVQTKLRDAALQVIATPAVRAKFATLGQDPGSGAKPEALAKSIQEASERQSAALKAIDFKPE